MTRKIISILLCAALTLLTGCTKTSQLHERLIVQGIGVDLVEGQYVVTMQVFDAVNSGNGEEDEALVVSAQGKSVLDAFTNITLQTGKEPLYSQNMVVIIGEDTAKQGINKVMDFFIRYYEARPEVDIFVVKDTAFKLLRSKGENGKLLKSQDISTLAGSGALNASVVQSTIRQVVSMLQNKTADPHMIALKMTERKDGAVVSVDGTAVFDGDVLTGYLGLEETQGAMMVLGKTVNGTQVLEIPDVGNVTYAVSGIESKIKVSVEDDKPVYDIAVNVTANLFEIDHSIRDKLPADAFDVMQAALEQRVKQLCLQAIKTTVMDYRCDVFHLGNRLWKQQPDYYRRVSDQWKQIMTTSQFRITVKADLKRVGQEVNPL